MAPIGYMLPQSGNSCYIKVTDTATGSPTISPAPTGPPKTTGSLCQSHGECETTACALEFEDANSEQICCPSGLYMKSNIIGNIVCEGILPEGAYCSDSVFW